MSFFRRQRFMAAVDEANAAGYFVLPVDDLGIDRIHELAKRLNVSPLSVLCQFVVDGLQNLNEAESYDYPDPEAIYDRIRKRNADLVVRCSPSQSENSEEIYYLIQQRAVRR